MKKLTLNETWKLCLAMWKWIAGERKRDSAANVNDLKGEWLDKHSFGNDDINAYCFFCEYTRQQGTGCYTGCPGKMVSKYFSCCRVTYHHRYKPIAFYNKLISLNRKRKKK